MNIFLVDEDPVKAAEALCDKHLGRMMDESSWLMSWAHARCGEPGIATNCHASKNINNPCTKWVCESLGNYIWLAEHAVAIMIEYQFRYGKLRKSADNILTLINPPAELVLAGGEFSPTLRVVADELKAEPDGIVAYRRYYNEYKRHFKKWKKGRNPPEWYTI